MITYTTSQFSLVSGAYYSPAFQQDPDLFVSVAVSTAAPATISMQHSIDNTNWIDVPDSSFPCANLGLQTFTDCQVGLYYRVKSTVEPTDCKILI